MYKRANWVSIVFDGSRRPITQEVQLLIRNIDGNQKKQFEDFRNGPYISCEGLPCFDNFGDYYTVIVSVDSYCGSGFRLVKISPNTWQHVDLMLLRKDRGFSFSQALWDNLRTSHPQLFQILSSGAASDAIAKDRYDNLSETEEAKLAAFRNIATIMAAIYLPTGAPLDDLKELVWDEMAQDRFFAHADKHLIDQVVKAAAQGNFVPEFGSGLLHPGARRSYKQCQLGEVNVQLTFHEGDRKQLRGVECIKGEPDFDNYKDLGAHALLEVVPNTITGRPTNPKEVYVLRWIAGRQAGVPEFNPPYTIV